jgi:hypothetical protein
MKEGRFAKASNKKRGDTTSGKARELIRDKKARQSR